MCPPPSDRPAGPRAVLRRIGSVLLLLLALPGRGQESLDPEERRLRALREPSGRPALDARNAWGLALLRQGRDQEAVEVLSELERLQRATPGVPDLVRSRYLYNWAVALERTSSPRAAVAVYGESLRLDPGFEKAASALARSSAAVPDAEVAVLFDGLFAPLLATGRSDEAAEYLRPLLRQESRPSAERRLLLWLVRVLVASQVDPDSFRKEWKPSLAGKRPDASPRVARIVAAYEADLPLVLDPARARDLTAPWSADPEQAVAFSTLLRTVGDAYRRQGDRKSALARYALAWTSAADWQAAVYVVETMRQSPAELDPGDQIFNSCLSEPLRDALVPRDEAGWRDLARWHALLAQELEKRSTGSADAPRILEQWRRAVEAHERANAQTPVPEPAPGFYAGLAAAYRRSGAPEAAMERDRTAAEQYLTLERPDLAQTHFRLAGSVEPQRKDSVQAATLAQSIANLADQLADFLSKEDKRNVAVVPFQTLDGEQTLLGGLISEELEARFFMHGAFNVIQRAAFAELLEEVKTSRTGMLAPVAIKRFATSGVDTLVLGTIVDDLQDGMVTLNCRLVDVETGRILAAVQTRIVKDDVVRHLMATREPVSRDPVAFPRADPPRRVVEQQGILFEIISCSRRGETVACDLQVTARGDDRDLALCLDSAVLIDDRGTEYRDAPSVQDLFQGRSVRRLHLLKGVPVRTALVFDDVLETAGKAALIEVVCGCAARQRFSVRFRDVSIQSQNVG
jgi:tetratricopeptide (TPR) repeat protein